MAGTTAISIEAGDTVDELHRAERGPDALPRSAEALRQLAPIDRMHVLAPFAALHRQEPRP
ncbi:hypothetical protein [Methylobacterium durans]|uniref:hypothetical protein n=1 Tax=Methylobacterium durans TaxID=2202825 RepID=UPI0013A55D53|nr:hypothetical protein [Methylobacterium durans]